MFLQLEPAGSGFGTAPTALAAGLENSARTPGGTPFGLRSWNTFPAEAGTTNAHEKSRLEIKAAFEVSFWSRFRAGPSGCLHSDKDDFVSVDKDRELVGVVESDLALNGLTLFVLHGQLVAIDCIVAFHWVATGVQFESVRSGQDKVHFVCVRVP